MTENDREQQQDELEVLESIFPDIFSFEGEHRVAFRFRDDVRLSISLPEEYPSSFPPIFELSSPYMASDKKIALQNLLNEAYVENIGMPVLYIWASTVIDFLTSNAKPEGRAKCVDLGIKDAVHNIKDIYDNNRCPSIVSGETFYDRRSTFQAHLARLSKKEDVDLVMSKLLQNNKVLKATHNIFAWRLTVERDGKVVSMYDCKDDGEFGASARMLDILEKMGASNVIVVVSRWYGGIHLGPDRFRHINNLTRQILTENGMENRIIKRKK